MLPDAAPESGRGALVGDDAAGGPRRPSSGRGRAAGGRDRGRTVVRARAVRNLPVAPAHDVELLVDVCVGSSWEVIKGKVLAGKTTATFEHRVALVTRSKFLTCRISLCVEPYDQLHHLAQPQDAGRSASDCKSASAEMGYVEIGRACVAVHELVDGGRVDWFPLGGLGSAHGTKVLLELHYAPEGTDERLTLLSASATGPWPQEQGSEKSRSPTPDSSDFTEGNSSQEPERIVPFAIRPEHREASKRVETGSTPYHPLVQVDRHDIRTIRDSERLVQNEEDSLHASPRAPNTALRDWRSEAMKPVARDVEEEKETTGHRSTPVPDARSDDSCSDLLPDSETSCSALSPDDEDWSETNGIDYGHEDLNVVLEFKHGAPLVSENMLYTLKGQVKRDLARALRVPYSRVEIRDIQRRVAAKPAHAREDAHEEHAIHAEWVVGVRLRNDCDEPARDARRLLYDMVKLCRDPGSFVHRAFSTQNLTAVFQSESDMLWQRGVARKRATKSDDVDAGTSEGIGWSGLEGDEGVSREGWEQDTHGDAFMHGFLYGVESDQTRKESFQVFDVVSEIHKMEARTWTVSKTNDTADCSSIRAALAKCKPGDTVVVGSGEYHEDLCLGVDRISLLAASETVGYGHLNTPSQHFANASKSLPSDEMLLDPATPCSVLQLVVKKEGEGGSDHADCTEPVILYGDANFDSPALYSTSKGVVIAGIQIYHTGRAGREAASVVVADGDAHFRNVIVSRSASTGVAVECGVSTFFRCAFVGCHGVGLESKQHGYIRMEKCLVADCEKGGLHIASDHGALCRQCCVYANRGAGITDKSLPAHDASSVFEANVIRDNHGGGVLSRGASSGKFLRNTLSRNQEAEIVICDASSASFEGNRLEAALGNGVLIDDKAKPRLFGNEVRASRYAGVEVRGHASPSLDRNVIRDCATTGIHIGEDAGGHYQDNKIVNNQHVGVLVMGRANVTFQSNFVERNSWAGILVQGDAKLEMHKDRLVGNSGPNMSVEDKGTIVARACVFEGGSSHGLVISSSQCCRLIVCHLQLNEAGNVLVEKNGRVEMIRCQLSGSTRTHAGPSVWCREGAGVTLTECTLRHSREALVKVGDQSKATMQGTLLERGESDGILVENEACAQLTHVIVRECDTALHLKGDARIEGDENEILDNRVTGVLSEDNSYLALEQTTLSGSRVSNISLTHNACIELRGALVHDSKTGIELDGLSHGTIQGSHIHSCSVGIHIRTEAGAQTNVLESSIGYCKRLGVLCGRTCAPTLSSCDIRHCGESCIRMAEHTKARFVQCVVHASTAQGVWVGDQAGGCIEGCVITNNNTAGIRLNDQACPDIVDNKIYNNPAGIVVADSARPQISANVFTDNKLSAVQMLDSSGPIVENNKILQGHDIGVMICDLSKGILRQNQLCGAKSTAFELQDDCDPLLEDNVISEQRLGIVCRHTCRGIVHTNEFFNISQSGIQLLDRCSTTLERNSLRQCHVAVSAAGNTMANIRRNIVEQNVTGLAVFGSSLLLVEENHVSRNREAGVSIGGHAKGEFKKNTITENEGPNIKVSASAAPILFDNMIAAGLSQGLVFSGSAKGTALKNKIELNQLVQVLIKDEAAPILQNNFICNGKSTGILITDRSLAYVSQNDICANQGSAIILSADANPKLVGNSCQENGKCGLEIREQAQGVVLRNAFVRSMAESILVSGEATPLVQNNLIQYGLHDGVLFSGSSRPVFTHNRILNSQLIGLHVREDARPSARENVVRHCKSHGVSLQGFSAGVFSKNIVQDNEKVGFLVMSGASATVEHNLVKSNQSHGMVFDECAAGVCTANVLRHNKGEPLLVLGSACPVMQVRLPDEHRIALLMGLHRRLGRNSLLRSLRLPGSEDVIMRHLFSYCYLMVDTEKAMNLARHEHLHSEMENEVEEESLWTGRASEGRSNA